MSNKIYTIGRQFGSGGHEIGERLAKKLNIPFYDKEILDMAAEKLGVDASEVADVDEKAVHNFVINNFGFMTTDRNYTIDDYSRPLSERIYRAQASIIRELADQGPCVIVGRCADYVLKDRDDVLSVFVCADDEYRINRLMEVRNYTRGFAENQIDEVDSRRRKYYNKYTTKTWDAQVNHHLVLNSSLLGLEKCVDMLADMYEK